MAARAKRALFLEISVQTIFDTVLSSRKGLGDIGVLVDPFTGKVNTCIPAAARYPGGPVLKAADFFDDAQRQMVRGQIEPKLDPRMAILCDVLNPGAAHYKGKYLLAARFANIRRFTDHFLAESEDGIHWTCNPRVLDLPDLPKAPKASSLRLANPNLPKDQLWRPGAMYDARITQMGDEYLIAMAVDYDTLEPEGKEFFNICDNVLFRTRDFKKFEFVSTFLGNTRNGVMFPRKIDGYYWCAARPNSFTQSGSALMGQSTFLFRSKDLVDWEEVSLLFTAGHGWLCHGGPGFPPFETEDYWVLGAHGVEIHGSHRVHYRGAVAVLDKKTMKLVAPPAPILDPSEQYELDGIVDNVTFPSGILFSDGRGDGVKAPDTRVAIYYGGADRVIGTAISTVERLVAAGLGTYNPFTNR